MAPQSDLNSSFRKPLLNTKCLPVAFSSKSSKKQDKSNIKCVIVGDGAVGKTSLAVSYSTDVFPREYIPTAFDNYNVDVQVDGQPMRVQLCDTAGQDELDPLRSLCYPDTDVFMLCFSVVQPHTFHSAATRWQKELRDQGAAIVLVGTQADLYHDPSTLQALQRRGLSPVPPGRARELARRLGAPYVETSALTCCRLKEAFDEAITVALRRRRRLGARRGSLWRRLCCVVR